MIPYPSAFGPLIVLLLSSIALAQEQIDKGDAAVGKTAVSLTGVTLRARVAQVSPNVPSVLIAWRRGGEGLGGVVERGSIPASEKKLDIEPNTWTTPLPIEEIIGKGKGTRFATITMVASAGKKAEPL